MCSMLSRAAGVIISRPTAAIAFLCSTGVDSFEKRVSKLASRRNHAAHPDGGRFRDLSAAMENIPHAARSQYAATFRPRGNSKRAADASSETDFSRTEQSADEEVRAADDRKADVLTDS
ncbi:unnamed protein product [Prorocentrum cordatum]|uniref:Uncharacterized protein n=1 Tax=Prorocentrum cordatum TaxID=2364126 RepID=A0ABN9PYC3_9DINO|nr:unnamed protein product [Polarella glacialis]